MGKRAAEEATPSPPPQTLHSNQTRTKITATINRIFLQERPTEKSIVAARNRAKPIVPSTLHRIFCGRGENRGQRRHGKPPRPRSEKTKKQEDENKPEGKSPSASLSLPDSREPAPHALLAFGEVPQIRRACSSRICRSCSCSLSLLIALSYRQKTSRPCFCFLSPTHKPSLSDSPLLLASNPRTCCFTSRSCSPSCRSPPLLLCCFTSRSMNYVLAEKALDVLLAAPMLCSNAPRRQSPRCSPYLQEPRPRCSARCSLTARPRVALAATE